MKCLTGMNSKKSKLKLLMSKKLMNSINTGTKKLISINCRPKKYKKI